MKNFLSAVKLANILSIVLGLAVLASAATLIYVVTAPPPEDAFTEFYILDPNGKAVEYPTQLKVGEEMALTLVIINREHETTSYRVEISINGAKQNEMGPIELERGQRSEKTVNFTLEEAGENQRVDFLLYTQKQSSVYESLYIPVKVED